jgi:hypothetical protein
VARCERLEADIAAALRAGNEPEQAETDFETVRRRVKTLKGRIAILRTQVAEAHCALAPLDRAARQSAETEFGDQCARDQSAAQLALAEAIAEPLATYLASTFAGANNDLDSASWLPALPPSDTPGPRVVHEPVPVPAS